MDSLETSRGNQVSLKYLGFMIVWDKGRQWQILELLLYNWLSSIRCKKLRILSLIQVERSNTRLKGKELSHYGNIYICSCFIIFSVSKTEKEFFFISIKMFVSLIQDKICTDNFCKT